MMASQLHRGAMTLCCALAMILAACSADSSRASSLSSAAATTGQPAASGRPTSITSDGLPAGTDAGPTPQTGTCAPASLQLAVAATTVGYANSQSLVQIVIVNRGPACFLEGFPVLTFYDTSGGPLPTAVQHTTEPPSQILLSTSQEPLAETSSYAGQAIIRFSYSTKDAQGELVPTRPVARVDVRLPGSSDPIQLSAQGYQSSSNPMTIPGTLTLRPMLVPNA
ncbi:MAG: DUF4232 domain-containing protein [Acidimicrobiales bacterium]